MDILADTNILLRRVNRNDAQYKEVRTALSDLRQRGHRVCVVPQIIVEFWNVASRPLDRNGLGLLPRHVERIVVSIEEIFGFLPEKPEVYPIWKHLVGTYSVSGLKVHDARIAASAMAYGIELILTFNVSDFRRYPGLKAIHPREVGQMRI